MKDTLQNNRGFALPVTLMVVVLLISITGATLALTRLELNKTSNYKLATQALGVADAALQHALSEIPPGIDFPYTTEIFLVDPSTAYPSLPGFTYSVKALNAAVGTQAKLTSTARGPNDTKRVLVAYARRGGYGFGTVHMPGDADHIDTQFFGTSFIINGYDRCNAVPAIPGITTTDPAMVNELVFQLDPQQKGNVTGAGVETPSIQVKSEPTLTVKEMADAYLALGIHVELDGGVFAGNDIWGTSAAPRITLIHGDATIQGTIEGYGVLIVDGDLDIAGNFTFNGLVIGLGIGMLVTGNANIFGAMLIEESAITDSDAELDYRGNAVIQYDSCALAAAEGWIPLPKAVNILAWKDEM